MKTEPDAITWLETVVSAETASDIVAHRKAKRCALTARAAKTIAHQLSLIPEELREEAIDHWQNMDWRGFKAEWAMRAISQATARRGIVGAAINMVTNDGQGNNRGFGRHVQQLSAIAKH